MTLIQKALTPTKSTPSVGCCGSSIDSAGLAVHVAMNLQKKAMPHDRTLQRTSVVEKIGSRHHALEKKIVETTAESQPTTDQV